MDTDTLLGEIIDRCVQRLANGEALDAVLRSYPEHADDLRALLMPAQTMLAAAIPDARPAATSLALNRMLSEVQTAATQSRSRSRGFLLVWLGSLRARPLAYQAIAVAGAVALFGGVSLGATAATGGAPSPVRRILRISSDSQRKVTLKGSIVSLQGDVLMLRPDAGAATDVRTIMLSTSTKILRPGHPITRADLRPGDSVEIDGTVRNGDRIEATAIRADGAPAAASTASAVPDATAGVQLPASGTPDADDKPEHETPGPARGEGDASDDQRTPDNGDAPDADTTPEPSNDGGDGAGDDHHEGATPAAGATSTPDRGEGHSGTPQPAEPAHEPEPTAKPGTTPAPEATEKPDSPKTPEPPEDH